MRRFSSSGRSRIGILWFVITAFAAVSFCAGAVHAEGVVSGASFVAGGMNQGVSLVSGLGDTAMMANVTPASLAPVATVTPRPASPRERTEAKVGGDLFRNLRLAFPLVAESTVGTPVDAPMPAEFRAMSGPMVGVRPHPRTWGSSFAR